MTIRNRGFIVVICLYLLVGTLQFLGAKAGTIYRREMRGQSTPPSIPADVPSKCSDAWYGREGYRLPRLVEGIGYSTNTKALAPLAAQSEQVINMAFSTWNSGTNTCALPTMPAFGFHKVGETDAEPRLGNRLNEVTFFNFEGLAGLDPLSIGVAWMDVDPGTGVVLEFDMGFDARRIWTTTGVGGAYDIQNAVTHMIGTVTGLAGTSDVQHANLVMFTTTWPGDTGKRDLALGDLLGRAQVA